MDSAALWVLFLTLLLSAAAFSLSEDILRGNSTQDMMMGVIYAINIALLLLAFVTALELYSRQKVIEDFRGAIFVFSVWTFKKIHQMKNLLLNYIHSAYQTGFFYKLKGKSIQISPEEDNIKDKERSIEDEDDSEEDDIVDGNANTITALVKNPITSIPPSENLLINPTEPITLPTDEAEMFMPERINLNAWTNLKMENSYPSKEIPTKPSVNNSTFSAVSNSKGGSEAPLGSFTVPMTSSNVVSTELPVRTKKRTNGIL